MQRARISRAFDSVCRFYKSSLFGSELRQECGFGADSVEVVVPLHPPAANKPNIASRQ